MFCTLNGPTLGLVNGPSSLKPLQTLHLLTPPPQTPINRGSPLHSPTILENDKVRESVRKEREEEEEEGVGNEGQPGGDLVAAGKGPAMAWQGFCSGPTMALLLRYDDTLPFRFIYFEFKGVMKGVIH